MIIRCSHEHARAILDSAGEIDSRNDDDRITMLLLMAMAADDTAVYIDLALINESMLQ
jgi:hypothetical protein